MNIDRDIVILCLVGPAGSGKTSMMLRLLRQEQGRLKNSVSVTTRVPRDNEKNGVTREFVSKEEFKDLIASKALFEHELSHGNYYGTRQSTIDNAFSQDYDLIFDIDIRGALSLQKAYPKNVCIVFMTTASQTELLERMKNRGTVEKQELKVRMETTQGELKMFFDNFDKIDYFLINVDKETTFGKLSSVLQSERLLTKRLNINELKEYV